MNALALLDSRSFRNKLDAFISIASKKRAKDEDIAEYLQPVLDAAAAFGGVMPMAPKEVQPSVMGKPLTDEERIIPQKQRSIIEVMDGIIADFAPKVAATGMDAKGLRWVSFPGDIPMSELTGYLNDKTDAPFFIDPQEMTMMDTQGNGWILPCRTR